MATRRFQDQPYKIVFSSTAVINQAAQLFIFIVFSVITVYLLFFVPLSYINPERIQRIWPFGVWILWSLAFFSSIFHISLKLSYKREIDWLYWLAFLSNWIIWSVVYTLNFLGLYPSSVFVPLIAMATASAFFLLETLFMLVLRYNHYLSRSMSFAEQGSVLLALISALNLFFLFGQGVRSIISWEYLFSSSAIIFIFQLIGLGIITYFAANIDLNDPRSSRYKTIISFAICLAVVVAKYLDTGVLSFWWLGMAALSSSIFYVAHSPTRRKSTGLAVALFSGMYLALFLDQTTFITTTNQLWTAIKDYILPLLGIIVAVVAGGESIVKTIFPELRSHKISRKDVVDGSQDFVEVDGLSVYTIDQIMRTAILTQNFDFCDKLLHNFRPFPSSELRDYFEIYYLCVRFAFDGFVKVTVDSEQGSQYIVIDSRSDFISYINERFPSYIHDYDIWYGYVGKGYITEYLSQEALNKACPETLYTRAGQYLRNAFRILLVFLILSSQVLSPWMNMLPSLISRLATWNSVRKNEVRLILTSAMQPYQYKDPTIRKYYALSMWKWVQNRELYAGQQRSGHFYMPAEMMESQIKYLEEIYSFYENKDYFYFDLLNEIGGYYKGLGNCKKALYYLEKVLADSESRNQRDFAIANSAECYRKQDLAKALSLLHEAYENTGYIRSRAVLADIYYNQEKYGEVVNLLRPISDTVDALTLSILGESLYQEGAYADAIGILEKALASDTLVSNDDRRIRSYLYLGAAYFEIDEPFSAAENFYKAFSEQLCPFTPVLSASEQEMYLPVFKSAIDAVSQRNPRDFRTNLWNFVYFLYAGDTEKAFTFFKVHLNGSPEYEQRFTECVLSALRNK